MAIYQVYQIHFLGIQYCCPGPPGHVDTSFIFFRLEIAEEIGFESRRKWTFAFPIGIHGEGDGELRRLSKWNILVILHRKKLRKIIT